MAKTTLTLKKTLDVLQKSCKDAVLSSQEWERDDRVVVSSDKIIAVLKTLKEHKDLGFEFLMDQTAVDYMGDEQRFEVIYQLYSFKHNYRLRVKTRVSEKSCEIETATGLWKAADWFEREIWDMYGITFKGHPNLKRLLMYEEFEGHPLRKDYPLKGHQPIVALRKPIEPPKEFQYQLSPTQRRARLDLED